MNAAYFTQQQGHRVPQLSTEVGELFKALSDIPMEVLNRATTEEDLKHKVLATALGRHGLQAQERGDVTGPQLLGELEDLLSNGTLTPPDQLNAIARVGLKTRKERAANNISKEMAESLLKRIGDILIPAGQNVTPLLSEFQKPEKLKPIRGKDGGLYDFNPVTGKYDLMVEAPPPPKKWEIFSADNRLWRYDYITQKATPLTPPASRPMWAPMSENSEGVVNKGTGEIVRKNNKKQSRSGL